MVTYLNFRYNTGDFRLPIGTNIINGKQLRKLIKYVKAFTLYKSTRLWINGVYITNTTNMIFSGNIVLVITDEWSISSEEGLDIPTLVTIELTNPVITIE